MDFTQALGNFGSLYKVESGGRVWQLEFITDRAKAEVEIAAKQHALATCRKVYEQGLATDAEYQKDRAAVLRDIGAGKYVFWSENVFGYLQTEAGQTAFTLALLAGKQPDVTWEAVKAILDDPAGAAQLADALEAIKAEVSDRVGKLKAQAEAKTAKTPT